MHDGAMIAGVIAPLLLFLALAAAPIRSIDPGDAWTRIDGVVFIGTEKAATPVLATQAVISNSEYYDIMMP